MWLLMRNRVTSSLFREKPLEFHMDILHCCFQEGHKVHHTLL